MLGAPPFPTRSEDLTNDFLSQAIGTELSSFERTIIGADRGMIGEIARIDATTVDGRRLEPLVAKFAAGRAGSRESSRRGGVHRRELEFYDRLAPRTPVRVPRLVGAWYDPETDDFFLLQEAVDADLDVDQIDGIGPDRVTAVATEIAGCHAAWWGAEDLREFDWLPTLDGPARRTNLAALATQGWEPLCEMLGDDFDAADRTLGDELPAVLDARLVEAAAMTPTLIHSDLRADNLLFTPGSNQVSIIDWQGCGIGPAGWDLAYLLTQSLTIDDRRTHEDSIIDRYLAALATHGVALDRAELMTAYRTSLVFGLVVAASLPIVADVDGPRTRALARSMATRAVAALRDHDVAW